ncbi:MAG: PfkB family carbohydrate kinase [Chitinophagaceae bacterium]
MSSVCENRCPQAERRRAGFPRTKTWGTDGVLLHEGASYRHPGYKVRVGDTVGSGDSLLATFLSKTIEGAKPEQCLSFACAVGTTVASHTGAWVDYTQEEVQQLLSSQTAKYSHIK